MLASLNAYGRAHRYEQVLPESFVAELYLHHWIVLSVAHQQANVYRCRGVALTSRGDRLVDFWLDVDAEHYGQLIPVEELLEEAP